MFEVAHAPHSVPEQHSTLAPLDYCLTCAITHTHLSLFAEGWGARGHRREVTEQFGRDELYRRSHANGNTVLPETLDQPVPCFGLLGQSSWVHPVNRLDAACKLPHRWNGKSCQSWKVSREVTSDSGEEPLVEIAHRQTTLDQRTRRHKGRSYHAKCC